MFLPGQDDIEALQSLLDENLPDIVGLQHPVSSGLHGEKKNGEVIESEAEVAVKKGILKDFEIRPLYAAMPPEEQVHCSVEYRIAYCHGYWFDVMIQ